MLFMLPRLAGPELLVAGFVVEEVVVGVGVVVGVALVAGLGGPHGFGNGSVFSVVP
jgi:hypothetical protein